MDGWMDGCILSTEYSESPSADAQGPPIITTINDSFHARSTSSANLVRSSCKAQHASQFAEISTPARQQCACGRTLHINSQDDPGSVSPAPQARQSVIQRPPNGKRQGRTDAAQKGRSTLQGARSGNQVLYILSTPKVHHHSTAEAR